jgi:ADP-heptose:LPS heptosyltransferase
LKKKILIIQTAFIGDVVLATSLIESLGATKLYKISILVRSGNEALLENHPHLDKILVWNKKKNKFKNLIELLFKIRKEKFDVVINLQRFGSTGFLTSFSGAKNKIGFSKNPFSFLFNKRVEHDITEAGSLHEIERNHKLIKHLEGIPSLPLKLKLYPSDSDLQSIEKHITSPIIIIAPGSVWFTKQFPIKKWIDFLNEMPKIAKVVFIGGPEDSKIADEIMSKNETQNCVNLCGHLSFLQSAALLSKALRVFVNDSAPLHIASAMNAKTTAVFCSTVPEFGFGPLSDDSVVVEIQEKLVCRPCGLHGKKECPHGHFDCGMKININDLLKTIG